MHLVEFNLMGLTCWNSLGWSQFLVDLLGGLNLMGLTIVDPLGWSHFGDPLGWSCFLVDPLGLTWWIHLGLTSYWIHLGLTCWIPLGWSHLVPSVGEEPSETNKMDRLAGSCWTGTSKREYFTCINPTMDV